MENEQIIAFYNPEDYIYKRKDFLDMGVPEGSFNKIMKDLGLNTPEFCIEKRIERNVKAKFYTAKAYEKVGNYLEAKNNTPHKQAMRVYERNRDLEKIIDKITIEYERQLSEERKKTDKEREEKLEIKRQRDELEVEKKLYEFEKANEIEQAVKKAKEEAEERVKAEMNKEIEKAVKETENAKNKEIANASLFGIIRAWRRNKKLLKLEQGKEEIQEEPKFTGKTIAEQVKELKQQKMREEKRENETNI